MASWKCNECGRTNPEPAAWCSRCCNLRDGVFVPPDPPTTKAQRVEMIDWFRKRAAGRVSSSAS